MGLLTPFKPHPEALRFVPFFVGINLIGGVHLLFFPAWLSSIGFSATSVGLLLGSMNLLRVVTGPALGIAADAFAARRLAIICLMSLAAMSYAGYAAFSSIALVVLFSFTSSGAFSAIGPLLEGITLKAAVHSGFDYGRVRLWGSAAFIAMNFIGGSLITAKGVAIFPWVVTVAGTLALSASFVLPADKEPRHDGHAAIVRRQAWALIRQPLFLLFVATAGIAQACHAFYYAFGTLNWQALGYSANLIGFLWALGVVAEIILLSYSTRVVARLGPMRLLALGAGCGLVRWTVLALSPPLWVLIPVQCLHAGTFCAAHLGAMYFILRATPSHLVGTAQSIYGAVTLGIFFTLAQYGSGFLFANVGSLGYLAMTAMSGLALVLALLLGRLWNGGTLAIETTEGATSHASTASSGPR
jgi:PPP family 3-phenylpropionic acid transporter